METATDTFERVAGFHELADALPIMVFQLDRDGRLVYANEAWFAYTKLPRTRASFEPEAWRAIVHPDDYQRVIDGVTATAQRHVPFEVEHRLKPVDGGEETYRWVVGRGRPRFVEGTFDGLVGAVIDIQDARDREEAERRLREAATTREASFKALGEAIPQFVWTADASGALDWYNQRWYEYTGQTPEEALGWGWQAVQHPDDFPFMFERWTEALETGAPVEMEFRLRGKDGAFRWFLTLINPVKDDAGNVIRWFGTNTDIHDRKMEAQRTLRIAQTLQEVFLPERLPTHPDLRFDALYVPAESDGLVGGDWYDAFALDEGRIAVSIGDVAGHGLDAGVIAGRLRQTLFVEALANDDPAAVLQKVDTVLRAQSETIATALFAIIDVTRGTMSYASAGHPAPVVVAPNGEAALLREGGAPLGTGFAGPQGSASTHRISLGDGDTVIFYTDGLIEHARDVVIGQAELLSHSQTALRRAFSARDLYASMIGEGTSRDDVAILIAQWRPPQEAPNARLAAPVKRWRFHSSHVYSAQTARHELMLFVRAYATAGVDTDATEAILGELLANAVEHAPGLVEVTIDLAHEPPLLTMRDSGEPFALDDANTPADAFAEDGRGLFIVKTLSPRVEMNAAPGFGKEIRVELPRMPSTLSSPRVP